MYVEINPPKSRHSLPRNSHIASLLLLSPVDVGGPCVAGAACSTTALCSSGGGASVRVASDTGQLLGRRVAAATLGRVVIAVGGNRRLQRPAVRPQQQDRAAEDDQHPREDDDVAHDRQGDRQ